MKIYTYLQDGWADWECGYVLAGLRRNLGCEIVIASPDGEPVTSIGGIRTTPHAAFDAIEASPDAGYLLIGSDNWLEFDCKPTGKTLTRAFELDCPIGIVCGATVFAARIGLFEDSGHTSNGFEFLREHAGDYPGSQHYVSSPSAISDRNLVTASGLAPLTFSREYLTLVKGETPFDQDRYFAIYSRERSPARSSS